MRSDMVPEHGAERVSRSIGGGIRRAGRATLAGLFVGLPVTLAAGLGVAYWAYAELPPVPVPIENPITPEKAVLGKMLFWDEQLSTSLVVSCGTCHSPAAGGADPRIARNPGIDGALNTPDDILGSPGVIASNASNEFVRDAVFGVAPQITGRAANPMIDAAYAPELFWDGRAGGTFFDPQTGEMAIEAGGALENQASGPPLSSVEMAHSGVTWDLLANRLREVRPMELATNLPADVSSALAGNPDYPELFRRAFGDGQITAKRIVFAIATYQRTLIADQTPWDRFMAGEIDALTAQQQQGWTFFQGTARCNDCHTAPHFTDFTFRNIGVRPPAEDLGRQLVTGDPDDRGMFKVPGLRNSGLKRTFMHNGMFTNMGQVMGFYARAPGAPPQFPDNRDPIMPLINLPPLVNQAVTDFVVNGLTDPRVANETFPFDRPVLFADRPGDRATPIGGGTPGTGGLVPAIIVQSPPFLGNRAFRVGLDRARAGVSAQLVASTQPPVNGVITPQFVVGQTQTSAQGLATVFWNLSPREFAQGQVLFVQWQVSDPNAAGGTARSVVGRVPIFCGTGGCPTPCDSLDFNRDGDFPTPLDLEDFINAVAGSVCGTCSHDLDFNNDGDFPTPLDIEAFVSVSAGGPCL